MVNTLPVLPIQAISWWRGRLRLRMVLSLARAMWWFNLLERWNLFLPVPERMESFWMLRVDVPLQARALYITADLGASLQITVITSECALGSLF